MFTYFPFKLAFLHILSFMVSVGVSHAQVVKHDTVSITTTRPEGQKRISFGNAGTLGYFEPELEIVSFNLGGPAYLYKVEPGDFLSQEYVSATERMVFSDIPIGTSYVGFGARQTEPELGPWFTIGWAKFHRDQTGLDVLASASASVNSGQISPGLRVVPEPSAVWLSGFAALALLRLRRRR